MQVPPPPYQISSLQAQLLAVGAQVPGADAGLRDAAGGHRAVQQQAGHAVPAEDLEGTALKTTGCDLFMQSVKLMILIRLFSVG